MPRPATASGKRLYKAIGRREAILAIEAEAAAAERELMRSPEGAVAHDDDDRAAVGLLRGWLTDWDADVGFDPFAWAETLRAFLDRLEAGK